MFTTKSSEVTLRFASAFFEKWVRGGAEGGRVHGRLEKNFLANRFEFSWHEDLRVYLCIWKILCLLIDARADAFKIACLACWGLFMMEGGLVDLFSRVEKVDDSFFEFNYLTCFGGSIFKSPYVTEWEFFDTKRSRCRLQKSEGTTKRRGKSIKIWKS